MTKREIKIEDINVNVDEIKEIQKGKNSREAKLQNISNFLIAKKASDDEFYTPYSDIHNELNHYVEAGLLIGKEVLNPFEPEACNIVDEMRPFILWDFNDVKIEDLRAHAKTYKIKPTDGKTPYIQPEYFEKFITFSDKTIKNKIYLNSTYIKGITYNINSDTFFFKGNIYSETEVDEKGRSILTEFGKSLKAYNFIAYMINIELDLTCKSFSISGFDGAKYSALLENANLEYLKEKYEGIEISDKIILSDKDHKTFCNLLSKSKLKNREDRISKFIKKHGLDKYDDKDAFEADEKVKYIILEDDKKKEFEEDKDYIDACGLRFQDVEFDKYNLQITNPAFSLLPKYIKQCLDAKNDFIILTPYLNTMNACHGKELLTKQVYLGFGRHIGIDFERPEDENGFIKDVTKNVGCSWLTTFDIAQKYYNDNIFVEQNIDYLGYYNQYTISKSITIREDLVDKLLIDAGLELTDVNRNRYKHPIKAELNNIPWNYPGYLFMPLTIWDKYNENQIDIFCGTNIQRFFNDKEYEADGSIKKDKYGNPVYKNNNPCKHDMSNDISRAERRHGFICKLKNTNHVFNKNEAIKNGIVKGEIQGE